MVENVDFIMIAGSEVPVWCDLYVLNEIQEEYGTIGKFERALVGIAEDEEGKRWKKEPDIKTLMFALRIMVQEGIKKQKKAGIETDIDVEQVLMDADIPYTELAEMLHDVFWRCFRAKKSKQERKKEKKRRRWTLPGVVISG